MFFIVRFTAITQKSTHFTVCQWSISPPSFKHPNHHHQRTAVCLFQVTPPGRSRRFTTFRCTPMRRRRSSTWWWRCRAGPTPRWRWVPSPRHRWRHQVPRFGTCDVASVPVPVSLCAGFRWLDSFCWLCAVSTETRTWGRGGYIWFVYAVSPLTCF